MSEADIFVLLEGDGKGNSFEPVFAEYGHRCQQIAPQALGSPFCLAGTFHFPEKAFVDWACGPVRMPVRP
jgi:hypothetical protein